MIDVGRPVEDWEALAWMLWRGRHHTFPEIARFLASEGWEVEPAEVERSVMDQAHARLRRK